MGKIRFVLITITAIILFSLSIIHAQTIEYRAEGSTVKAIENGNVLWENIHDRSKRYYKYNEPGSIKGPIQINDLLYYSIGLYFYEARAADGVITRRILLPGPAHSLKKTGETAEITIGPMAYASEGWSKVYSVGPHINTVPFFLVPGIDALMNKRDAEYVLSEIIEADKTAPKIDRNDLQDQQQRLRPEMRPFLKKAEKELERLAQRDPTNPWYIFFQGLYLRDLGEKAAAQAAFEYLFNIDEAYHYELLAIARLLDEIDPTMGDKAFEMGMRFLMANGYEREQMGSLLGLIIHLGRPFKKDEIIDPQKDIVEITRMGERIWTFSPLCEGVSYMFQGLAKAHQNAGNHEAAAIWNKRAATAEPYKVFGGANTLAEQGLNALNVYFACMITVIVILIIRSICYFSTFRSAIRSQQGWQRWLFFTCWSKGELIGLIIIFLVLIYSGIILARGVAAIGIMAGTPMEAINGNLGHPSAVEYWKKVTGGPEGDFIYALTLQQAGDTDAAQKIYEKLDSPRAKVNLGVILEKKNKPREAKTLYKDALEKEPKLPEALYNLGLPVDSPRLKTAGHFGKKGPFLALPTPAIWTKAYISGTNFADMVSPHTIFSIAGDTASKETVIWEIINALLLVVFLMVLISLFLPRISIDQQCSTISSAIGWGIGFIIPGASRRLSVFGPVILTIFITSVFVSHAMALSKGMATNYLSVIAIPNFSSYFGIWSPIMSPSSIAYSKTASLWWIILAVNLILIAILEKVKPDPIGPFAKTKSE